MGYIPPNYAIVNDVDTVAAYCKSYPTTLCNGLSKVTKKPQYENRGWQPTSPGNRIFCFIARSSVHIGSVITLSSADNSPPEKYQAITKLQANVQGNRAQNGTDC
jgi:hypothetical protein